LTDECLEKASQLAAEGKFANIKFINKHLENIPFDDTSFDVVISNGYINLCTDKEMVFAKVSSALNPK